MTYPEQLAALVSRNSALGEQVASLRNLEAILKWAPGAGIPFAGIDLVQQDEYSYDLYLPLPDSRWLVFGVS
ncbi:hypothetical protein VT84_32645 [Gemmata sp. SH-PL17]|uniref:hypothetical protein n=1 Tax=Gemmata sp. SH-PL17 TaxID=1630693 RepID=UPI0004B48825|nr:hypothetical protein [Gemmata sp. SH-PL17]AMV29189.1 hypothetical protein VT84_32645 [Gemmata sp. SH-PL17]